MAILNKGHDFSGGEQVTSTKLDAAIDSATFTSQAVDNVSTQLSGGAIIVKDGGITTPKIANSGVTKGKIEDVDNMKVLGNTSGVSAAPQEVSILDEDDMASDSDTSIPTQQSVKAYVDGDSSFNVNEGYQKLPSGLIMQFGHRTTNNVSGFTTTTFPISFTNKCMFVNIVEEGGSYREFNIRNISVTGFESEAISVASNEARYFAIGY